MIAMLQGIKSSPFGEVLNVVLIDTATNDFENGIQIHKEMVRLGLAQWKSGNDSGYSSSPLKQERMPGRVAEVKEEPRTYEQGES